MICIIINKLIKNLKDHTRIKFLALIFCFLISGILSLFLGGSEPLSLNDLHTGNFIFWEIRFPKNHYGCSSWLHTFCSRINSTGHFQKSVSWPLCTGHQLGRLAYGGHQYSGGAFALFFNRFFCWQKLFGDLGYSR